MKILYFINSLIDKPGNIGVRAGHIFRSSEMKGFDITAICRGTATRVKNITYYTMGVFGHLPRILNAISIYIIPGGFVHRLPDIALFERFSLRVLFKLDNHAFKVAHVWDYCPQLIRELQRKDIKVVLDVPIAPISYNKRMSLNGACNFLLTDDRLNSVEQEAFKLADVIVAPSEFVRSELIEAGVCFSKIKVIEFGANIFSEQGNLERPRKEKKGLDFVFFGNVSKRKGVLELLDAWSHSDFKNDRLHLCGRVYPEVRDVISRANTGEVITPGFVDISEYCKKCDVFVLPSWLEGSAKATYEAMSLGLASIVTNSSGSIVRDGVDGFIVDAGNVVDLREKMVWMKKNEKDMRKMGVSASLYVKKFTWERYGGRLANLYKEVQKLTAL